MGNARSRQSLEEIQSQLAKELARAGVRGELELTEQAAILHVGTHQRGAPLGQLHARWAHLTGGERKSEVTALARQLTPILRRSLSPKRQTWFGVAAIVTITAALSFFLARGIYHGADQARASRGGTSQPTTTQPTATQPSDPAARARRVCEATQSRVMRGGTVGPMDAEGWALELRLLRPSNANRLSETEGTESFLMFNESIPERAILNWADYPAPPSGDNSQQVQVTEERSHSFLDTRVRFSGTHVRSYFSVDERIYWVRFAAALARESGAIHGALYARCLHSSTHHVGGWFQGQTAGAAADTLLYFMGAFVDSPFLSPKLRRKASSNDASQLLSHFKPLTQQLDKSELAKWLSEDGGMIAGSSEGPIMITFPFKDSNRASRASLRVARRLGIAVER